ncbi:carboxypeptidase-like regulatory domain-containing protein [Gilvibacter sp.]|uniref:carboxypeptidase-like regulatory domain-containing protein n=1 Tax=Gilvibacter sp. TaxID=2729997 RepID=UPI0025C22E13|nr:carboxypeptidase-like regulatory domain-containing protein [Gilvibacter sp.]NQX76390.1 carboxypeptidase-like regulatory domain-containing protein [Gilvibacter sp.]
MKKFFATLCLVLICGFAAAQTQVTGVVVDTDSSEPIEEARLLIKGTTLGDLTDETGSFQIDDPNLPLGEQVLVVSKKGYLTQQLPITIQSGQTVNIDRILMEIDLTEVEAQIGIISLSDNQLDDESSSAYNISGLLQASNDVFLNAAAFDFSATFFRPRGYDNANGKVLINGIEMNKQFNGRPQWSNWGGLNDAQRNREFTMGIKANEYQFGDLAGVNNIVMRASQYRQGGRVSYAMANRSYAGRIMGSYNSGVNQNGWAYSILLSRRFGDEGYIHGTFYDANSFFASVEKKINDNHSLNFSALYTPNRRGRSAPVTREIRDLKGIRYNPNWGDQNGERRNSRVRDIEEPVIMLNHYWNIGENTTLNTNVAYQFGKIGNSRIDNGGTRLVEFNGQEAYLGGARNPNADYYQNLPSFFLQDASPTAQDYQNAFLARQSFVNGGQLDWTALYRANEISVANGGNAIYVLQEDRTDDTQFTANTILSTQLTENITLNGSLNYRNLKSENFAEVKDLLGANGYLDVDFFAGDDSNTDIGLRAQSDLANPNRLAGLGDRYKYNYEINADVITGFAQAQFKYNKVDFFVGANIGSTSYQRTGLFENGNYPGASSLGDSEKVNFNTYGVKGGLTYKVTGRHLIDLNGAYFTNAPSIRNTFANARQNNIISDGIEEVKIQTADLSYIYRSPIVKGRITGFYTQVQDGSDIGFFFTENQFGATSSAFTQEVTTGIDQRHLGVELGVEAQLTPTVKVKAAASVGQYIFTNNPNVSYYSDDFIDPSTGLPSLEPFTIGDGTAKLENYHVAGGPERAYQIGFEYRDPDFWWVGLTTNYFSNAYVDASTLRRTDAFTQDVDGLTFNDYDPEVARGLLQQEQLDDYFLVNVVGGKSWKIGDYFVGFFATINNVLDQEYITGGFEQSRLANYRDVLDDQNNAGGPVFGNRYFFGNGTTYYLNLYLRF